jgi:hypothetical protein
MCIRRGEDSSHEETHSTSDLVDRLQTEGQDRIRVMSPSYKGGMGLSLVVFCCILESLLKNVGKK